MGKNAYSKGAVDNNSDIFFDSCSKLKENFLVFIF